ncbi:MAG: hypothetical protein J6W52_06445 [Bacteroidaceae bacterium]|nr:hypothetical protein [Bacteroidaceae bacterium]
MRRLLTLTAMFAILSINARKPITPRVSIFADHIYEIAHQENISFREAAQQVKALGYTGIDVRIDINPVEVSFYNSLLMQLQR